MKVLQVINSMMRSGGAEKFLLDLSLALNRINGVEVTVLSIASPVNNDFVDILKANGITHHILSDGNLYSPGNIPRLKKFLDKGKYDAVHVHLFPALYFASIAKSLSKSRFKLIFTEHNTSNRRRGNMLFRISDRNMYKRYDEIIAISDKVRDNLAAHIASDRISIINNGIDVRFIQSVEPALLKEDLDIPADATVVTMVSRLTPVKDFNTLISAIELLPDDFHVVFLGDGPMMPDLKSRAESSAARGRIHILGLRNDVFNIVKASDIIVLSTRHEGFSIAMLEAMACRKPFVASAVEGIEDLVSGVAELFEYRNASQLADSLKRLRDNHEHYESVAEKCVNFAMKYDINEVARKYLSYYS